MDLEHSPHQSFPLVDPSFLSFSNPPPPKKKRTQFVTIMLQPTM